MLEGFTKEELKEMAEECRKRYNKLFKETLQKPMLGEIGTNMQMVEELKDLNWRFEDEMNDYTDELFIDDLDGGIIDAFLGAEEKGQNVILCAQECLDCLDIAEHAMRGWINKDTHLPCDEYGNPLSEDGEHRVFEVIPGGKTDCLD